MSDIVKLSDHELKAAEILQECLAKRLTNRHAAEVLHLSIRQVQRLKRSFKRQGVKGPRFEKTRASQQPSVGAGDARAGPGTPAWSLCRFWSNPRPLCEIHGLTLSLETVPLLKIGEGLWKPQRAKRAVLHPLRERRAQRGELVQIDGSPIAWFEERAPTCTLLVFIDDATGELLKLFFAHAETTHAYFQATERYLPQHGRPRAFYSDKFGVFRINHPTDLKCEGVTQFARALRELEIELICANTPQAKGRVERVNQTFWISLSSQSDVTNGVYARAARPQAAVSSKYRCF